jgi:hypothetical protein
MTKEGVGRVVININESRSGFYVREKIISNAFNSSAITYDNEIVRLKHGRQSM